MNNVNQSVEAEIFTTWFNLLFGDFKTWYNDSKKKEKSEALRWIVYGFLQSLDYDTGLQRFDADMKKVNQIISALNI